MRFVPLVTALALGAAAAVLPAVPAGAITSYNSSPAQGRTNVGALIVEIDGDRFWACTGTMVDTDTFVTAAHCTTGWPSGTTFFVSLAQTIDDAALEQAAHGEAFSHPAFPGNSKDSYDLAVVQFDKGNADKLGEFTPAQLPTLGLLNTLSPKALKAQSFTVAGYGLQEATRGPGGHQHLGGGTRLQAPVGFHALNPSWVRLAQTQPQGNGGACYGDSGGPNFTTIQGVELLVSTTITGDYPCYATNVTYRLDTRSARDFLAPYVTLP